MEREKVTVWITASQGGRLALLSKRQRQEQAETLKEMRQRGIPAQDARIEIMAMRPVHWPNLEDVVAAAVAARLDAPDLAGPWLPLTATERGRMALAGRWPGPNQREPMVQRNYAMPTDLVERLRTASWRVSEKPLNDLARVDPLDTARRRKLIERLHSPARIIRQGLDRHGPWTSIEPSDS